MTDFELVALPSGATSLRMLQNHETFHPGIGPAAEARLLHIEQQRISLRSQATEHFVIWDVGLGAAANAIAAIEALRDGPAPVTLISFDHSLAPLQFALKHADELSYILGYEEAIQALLEKGQVTIGAINWQLRLGDFSASLEAKELPLPHAIFYDPYSAKSNPEMWHLEHFEKLTRRLAEGPPCLITNYSRSTAVRATWLLAGLYVGQGEGVGAKDQTTIASNRRELLARPLTKAWLKQVKASQNANILRAAGSSYGPIRGEDLERLYAHPQFKVEDF